jgi:hypothetical protein
VNTTLIYRYVYIYDWMPRFAIKFYNKQVYVKLIRYQFWCTRCTFRLLKSLQWYSGLKSWTSKNKELKTG